MEERENKGPPVYGYYDGDHLYGIAPVLAAIQTSKRNISELITQEGIDPSNKKDEKAASQILSLAKEKGIKIREFPKHDFNMMTDNRPHQGFVLRAEPLEMKPLNALEPSTEFKCVLALDEVWDPQNFGALLRSCHFLGVDGVVVCAKNSAPLSPVVSKASSGALEVMDVLSTANMMRFLDKSIENGWQVIGTSLEGSVNLVDAPLDKPTIVVLGNEGHGVRTNILNRCTQLVRIPGGSENSVVDSLNVSVTGGIILHHIISSKKH
jgi:21S rRNA (GM2251-2'-O)-methyltransferase